MAAAETVCALQNAHAKRVFEAEAQPLAEPGFCGL
jgi:hypothetical protein